MPNAYIRLMRLHQPTGIWLLLWPCWWGLALASCGLPSLKLLLLFGVGSIVMRGAGCIVNDIMDRDFDKHVERTRSRPLASGEITLLQALMLLFALLCTALLIALQMNVAVLELAAFSLLLVAAYPLMKRITWWPQAFLGLTFNWGALMGWVAVQGSLGWPAMALYAGGIFWTLGYDTIYAHQDKEDDSKIGVKSTALRLGGQSKIWIGGFYILTLAAWAVSGLLAHNTWLYYFGLAVVALHLCWQVKTVNLNEASSCMRIFRSNATLGWILFIALLAQHIV